MGPTDQKTDIQKGIGWYRAAITANDRSKDFDTYLTDTVYSFRALKLSTLDNFRAINSHNWGILVP